MGKNSIMMEVLPSRRLTRAAYREMKKTPEIFELPENIVRRRNDIAHAESVDGIALSDATPRRESLPDTPERSDISVCSVEDSPGSSVETNDETNKRVVKKSSAGWTLNDLKHGEIRKSLLSHDSSALNLRGFYNVFVILMIVANFQMVLNNVITYGVRIRVPTGIDDMLRNWPLLATSLSLIAPILGTWLIERFLAPNRRLPSPILLLIQFANAFSVAYLPYKTVSLYQPDPVGALILLVTSTALIFKICSIHHHCYCVREALRLGENLMETCSSYQEAYVAASYPKSFKLSHFVRFIVSPTMCFQFYYPSMGKIVWFSVIRHFVGIMVCAAMMKIIIDQYIYVTLQNTFNFTFDTSIKLSSLLVHFLERVLRLSIPTLYVWLLLFMALFHHWCNLLAELTLFGDRVFYEDWWNASSMADYWRKWNLPVHHFMNRHINRPLKRKGVPKVVCFFIVFFISAVVHEYVISVPLQLGWIGCIFMAFLAQVPLIYLTSLNFFRRHKVIGNTLFWCLFCFSGQPMVILVYFYLWAVKQGLIPPFNASMILLA